MMKKLMIVLLCVLGGVVVHAQSRWTITPEAGLVLNKENSSAPVCLGFKGGVGVMYQLKEAFGYRPSFSLRSGLYAVQQRGDHAAWRLYDLIDSREERIDYYDLDGTRYYLQIPVMANWGFYLSEGVRLNLAIGPYIGIGVGGNAHAFVQTTLCHPDEDDIYGNMGGYRFEYDPFKGDEGNDEHSIYSTSSRLDWGAAFSTGLTIKHVSFNIGYDLSLWQNGSRQTKGVCTRNHTVSFMFGYSF